MLYGEAGDDTLNGGIGNDNLSAGDGADTLDGGDGADVLYGETGDDALNGGLGNDNLSGGEGADTLDGGAGNDMLNGGRGNNSYLFGKGDGQDLVTYTYDVAVGKLNTLQIKAGVLPSEVVLKQAYDSTFGGNMALEVSIEGTTDKVTCNGFFVNDDTASGYNGVQQIKFADGTVWDLATIQAKLFSGTIGNDVVRGTVAADTLSGSLGDDNLNGAAGNDTLNGEAGNDMLYGEAGDDTLNGGIGNDTVYGDAGADTLDGGSGNDTLSGGAGSDIYLFGRGSGTDVINEYDLVAGNTDVLSIGSGVATDQLWFRRSGSNLEVSIIGSTDKTTIGNWYSGSAYQLEQFKTSDGKMLLSGQVDALVSAMAAFAPPAAGETTLPPAYQTSLNTVIAANWQ
jgi:Ca2+-binding RTX toxin-like protein